MALEHLASPEQHPKPSPIGSPQRAIVVVLVVSLLWRLPSFFDPPWVNDEGTYFAVAQAMAHGYRLYADVWENKPPALYLVYEGVYHSLGASLLAIRVLSALAALGTVVLTTAIARRYVSLTGAAVVGLLAGLFLGVPFLEGTTGNAEVFLILCTAGAVLLALRERVVMAAALMALAVLLKVVALFDATAVALLIFGYCRTEEWQPGAGTMGARFLAASLYGAVVAAVLGVAVVLAAVAGILGPMLQDALFYPLGYVGHANGGGLPWLAFLKLAILLVVTLSLRGRPFPLLWLAWASAGALISGRFFGHYALQALPPVCISLAMALSVLISTRWERRLVVVIPGLFVALAAGSAVVGWGMARSGHDTILARRLQWYANFIRMATRSESYGTYRDQIDDHVTRNIRIARALKSAPPGTALVWGNTPWVYVLSGRLPATPYTSSLRQPEVPGETASLRASVRDGKPAAVVVIFPPLPPLGSARAELSQRYVELSRVSDAALFVGRARPKRPRGR